ncbi:hypothetical protein PHG31p97 [Aeromonas phage 31]|uniref:Uncharacterized protein n=4 Tax=Biquartavirus TaxID=1912143 RepID=Q6U9K3_9CAUD|nr:hypothetical protein ST44RRORF099c [Aeromonas phage 44RR2.8t]YP_238826.1 hypothetical protein PHG31p97 [Aeromonas phage 31]APU00570.1 hypothetical protein [Aeromonas phage 44RR2.8t.2]APU00990.1 hypothetical protein [Aeromonas phage 31.2]APU01902.1 hypothetical protein [Aeromonas phage L9-6]APU02152.1 hypothetical protein [Aeromonas phage Riv-10]APU02399.1 hypothetical protein [Aeromonas phage SW69-9]UYD59652.1 hypothetical protein JNMOADIG_00123 [Aeromonas phage avDM5]UYD60374.1 hypothet
MKSSDVYAQVLMAQQFATEELKRKLAPVGKFVADEMIRQRSFKISFDVAKFPAIMPKDIVDYLRSLGYDAKSDSFRNESVITVTAKP